MTNEWTVNNMKGVTVFNKNHVDTKKQPMFFGQPLGMQRYDEFKYPVFDKLTTQQLGYFWRPERGLTTERQVRLQNTDTRTEAYLH